VNHDLVHDKIVDEHDALWQAISELEKTVVDQQKVIENLTQVTAKEYNAQKTDINIP
jgi:uncharacterized coiled-coil protein SlyX